MVRIGPALETFLTLIGLVLLVIIGIGLLTRPFWKRMVQFFRRWYERDLRLEQQQREEAECRRKAQQEIGAYCHDDILQAQSAAVPPSQMESTVSSGSMETKVQPVEVKTAMSEPVEGVGRAVQIMDAQSGEAQPLQAGRVAGRKDESNEG